MVQNVHLKNETSTRHWRTYWRKIEFTKEQEKNCCKENVQNNVCFSAFTQKKGKKFRKTVLNKNQEHNSNTRVFHFSFFFKILQTVSQKWWKFCVFHRVFRRYWLHDRKIIFCFKKCHWISWLYSDAACKIFWYFLYNYGLQ